MKKLDNRILLIAEIDEYIEFLTRWLEYERYQVIVLPNRHKLNELVRDIKPNVILMLRAYKGIKFCTTVMKKKALADIPVILLHDDDERFDCNPAAELTISFNRREVLSSIENLLSNQAIALNG